MANHRIRRKQHAVAYNVGWNTAASTNLAATPIAGNVLFLQVGGYAPDVIINPAGGDPTVDTSWNVLFHEQDPVVATSLSNSDAFPQVFSRWIFWKYAEGVIAERSVGVTPTANGFTSIILQEYEIVSTSSSNRIPDIQLLIEDVAVDTIHHKESSQLLNPKYSDISADKRYHVWFNFQLNSNTSITTASSSGGNGSTDLPEPVAIGGTLLTYRGTQMIYGATQNTAGNHVTLQNCWNWWPLRTEGINRSPLYPQSTKPSDWTTTPRSMSLVAVRMGEGIPVSEDHIDGESIEAVPPTITTSDISDVTGTVDLTNIEIAVGQIQSSELTASTALLQFNSFAALPPEIHGTPTLSAESSLALQSVLVGTVQISRMAVFTGEVAQRVTASMRVEQFTVTSNIETNAYVAKASDYAVIQQTVRGAVF